MAAIDLSGLPLRRMSPIPIDFGGQVTSPLNGATTWIDRLGARWAFRCETPPMLIEPDGRRWVAALTEARRRGAIMPIVQRGFDVGAPGAPVVATATAAGRVVPISSATPGYAIRAGQWISLIVGGQRYADQAAAQVIVAAGGAASVATQKLLRAPLPAGAVVEIGRPMVEGSIDFAEGWDIEVDGYTAFSFTIREDA